MITCIFYKRRHNRHVRLPEHLRAFQRNNLCGDTVTHLQNAGNRNRNSAGTSAHIQNTDMIPDQSLTEKPDKKLRELRNIPGHLVCHVTQHTVATLVLHHAAFTFLPVGVLLDCNCRTNLFKNTLVFPFLTRNFFDVSEGQRIKTGIR